jgi:hypothetical protein
VKRVFCRVVELDDRERPKELTESRRSTVGVNQVGLLMMLVGIVGAPISVLWWIAGRREARHAQALAVLEMLDRGSLDDRVERLYLDADLRERRVSVTVEAMSLAVAVVGLVLTMAVPWADQHTADGDSGTTVAAGEHSRPAGEGGGLTPEQRPQDDVGAAEAV